MNAYTLFKVYDYLYTNDKNWIHGHETAHDFGLEQIKTTDNIIMFKKIAIKIYYESCTGSTS